MLWNLFGAKKKQGRQSACRAPHPNSFRPRLELLEDRLAPAILTVTGTGDTIDANDGVITLREALTAAVNNSELPWHDPWF